MIINPPETVIAIDCKLWFTILTCVITFYCSRAMVSLVPLIFQLSWNRKVLFRLPGCSSRQVVMGLLLVFYRRRLGRKLYDENHSTLVKLKGWSPTITPVPFYIRAVGVGCRLPRPVICWLFPITRLISY